MVEVVGGLRTWCQPCREEVRSCLDLVIVSASLLPYARLVFDSSREFTPRRMLRRREGLVSVYTDLFLLEVVVEGLPR